MKHPKESGQTIIALLIFIMVAITLTVAATAVSIINLQTNDNYANGQTALAHAESGVENALLRLERNANYSGGTLTFPHGSATITVSGSDTKTIVCVGDAGNAERTVAVTAAFSSNTGTVTSWKETP
jgi:hypothetical protein